MQDLNKLGIQAAYCFSRFLSQSSPLGCLLLLLCQQLLKFSVAEAFIAVVDCRLLPRAPLNFDAEVFTWI